MFDFTFNGFQKILHSFSINKYLIGTYLDTLRCNVEPKKILILRHDVDRFPLQSLQMAKLEADMGVNATYYFRIIRSVFKPYLIQEIAAMGHEIGYHYEDLSRCDGNMPKSIDHFRSNLDKLRQFYPIQTICMHGSPLSKWDNKSIWTYYDYKEYGILADTSIDVDYNKVFYITDNGRAWNRSSVSIRDKVESTFDIPIKNSEHLISLVQNNMLPDHVMINAHPDTFFDFGIKYFLNWGFIEAKNVAKWIIVKNRLRN